ncbi:MAG: ParB/RepB/Spo0J family partition protein, partial [Bryobacterales bacterium]|nr:ParB/RepB/Spo0J family partition protein [Bryobacterales bacterium]
KTAKDQFQAYLTDPKRLAGTLLAAPEKTSPEAGHTGARAHAAGVSSTGRRLENLRVRHPARQRRLLASLADNGQQTPIVVIEQTPGRYLVIDGHKRLAALQQLGRDTVDAVVWQMSEAEALVLERSLRTSPPETALEQGWLLAEMESRLGCSIEELARRFDRSTTWVARRLALVEQLPEVVQQQVRQGQISAQIAMRFLVPVARVDAGHCRRMAQALASHPWTMREAVQLYHAWRKASGVVRRAHPGRTQAVPASPAAAHHAGKGTGADHRHRATSAGTRGIATAGSARVTTPEDPTRRGVIDRTRPTNRARGGTRNSPC